MKRIRMVLIIMLSLIFLAAAFYMGKYLWRSYQTQQDFRELKSEKTISLKNLWKQNHDLVGWITIKGTKIDYPVMQTKEIPEFYLRRNFDKKYSLAGTPFLDAASDLTQTSNLLIYGHNMQDGTMFHDLLEYANEEFYRNHQTFIFETVKYGLATYEVIAAFYTEVDTTDFRYYDYAGMSSQKDYETYVQEIKKLACYEINLTADGEQLLTLSTCSYHVDDKKGRFVVVAKKVQ